MADNSLAQDQPAQDFDSLAGFWSIENPNQLARFWPDEDPGQLGGHDQVQIPGPYSGHEGTGENFGSLCGYCGWDFGGHCGALSAVVRAVSVPAIGRP